MLSDACVGIAGRFSDSDGSLGFSVSRGTPCALGSPYVGDASWASFSLQSQWKQTGNLLDLMTTWIHCHHHLLHERDRFDPDALNSTSWSIVAMWFGSGMDWEMAGGGYGLAVTL